MSIWKININTKFALAALAMLLSVAASAEMETEQEERVAAVPENFPPYYMLDSNGQPAGFAIETLTRLAASSGFRSATRCPRAEVARRHDQNTCLTT